MPEKEGIAMANREDIIERVKKLLALAEDEGATEAEATAAALMAQRLIAQNDVEQWELHSSIEEPIEICNSAPARSRWRWRLAEVVAPAFRCRFCGNTERLGRWAENIQRIEFYGYRTDAKAAAITFDFLYKIGCRLAKRAARGKAHGTYNAYVLGYVKGIKDELEKQTEALMIVVPPKVKEGFEVYTANFKDVSTKLSYGGGHDAKEAYDRGVAEGRDAVRSRRMDEPEASIEDEPAALPGVAA